MNNPHTTAMLDCLQKEHRRRVEHNLYILCVTVLLLAFVSLMAHFITYDMGTTQQEEVSAQ